MTVDDKLVKQMVDRFLSWQLPADFNPDGGIIYTPLQNHQPTGTNLLRASQAEEMVRYIIAER